MEVVPGKIVYSKAGRDKGGYFIVMSVSGDYVFICDGKSRKADKPKMKKIKHVRFGVGHSDFVARKIANGEKVTNNELRRELENYNQREV